MRKFVNNKIVRNIFFIDINIIKKNKNIKLITNNKIKTTTTATSKKAYFSS